ncbi:MAG TPA: DUF4136 domain-containing protein [Candidatus Acidoferrum sp.]|nr:DUF4136 domain-containing protein [Candidatus Acidoferrum sp.]
MNTSLYTLIIAGALALAGCSSVKTHVDTGPIHARTFSFMDTGGRKVPSYAETRRQAHEMVQQAIKDDLAAKGLEYVPQGGDVVVGYLIIVGNNATTTALDEYFGYTPDASALADKVHKSQAVTANDRGYFEAGTLVIDFLDPKTSTLLKRATVHAQILRELPLEERKARLQKVVDEALGDLRIEK